MTNNLTEGIEIGRKYRIVRLEPQSQFQKLSHLVLGLTGTVTKLGNVPWIRLDDPPYELRSSWTYNNNTGLDGESIGIRAFLEEVRESPDLAAWMAYDQEEDT